MFLRIFIFSFIWAVPSVLYPQSGGLHKRVAPTSLPADGEIKPQYLEDPGGRWTLQDIRGPALRGNFLDFPEKSPNFGLTDAVIWVRLRLRNNTAPLNALHLRIPNADLHYVSFYFPVDGANQRRSTQYRLKLGGSFHSLRLKEIKYPLPVFKFSPPSNEEIEVYLRFETGASMSLPLEVLAPGVFESLSREEFLVQGLFYGILFMLWGYNLFLWISLRERGFVYYSLFVFCLTLFIFSFEGLAYRYLWTEYSWWNRNVLHHSGALTCFMALSFTTTFFDTGNNFPRSNVVANLLRFLLLSSQLLVFFVSYRLMVQISATLGITSFVFIIFLAGYARFRGSGSAGAFLAAWGIFLITSASLLLASYNLLPTNVVTEQGYRIGIVVMTLALGFFLGGRYNRAMRENHRLMRTQAAVLEDRVKLRTRELTRTNENLQAEIETRRNVEEKLKEARDRAESANQAKSEFLSNMSHEIRTPMNAILGMSDLLSETELNDEQKAFIKTLTGAGENLLSLINDVLDISKIEAGLVELENVPVNVKELLESTFAIFEANIREKGLEFAIQIAADVPERVAGDKTRLRQILLNLLGNAVKFTEKGGIQLIVRKKENPLSEEVGDKRIYLEFTVADSGIGINEREKQNIFGAFLQADSSITRRYGGSGLGLAICRRLVDMMRGEIRLESEPGRGSNFIFTIPLHYLLDDENESDYRHNGRARKNGDEIPLQPGEKAPLRILAVEDNEDNLLLLGHYFKSQAYRLDTAVNGKIALEIFQENEFDLVLMDIQMPVLDGHSSTRLIREWERKMGRLPTPIVALTAHALKEEIEKSLAAGCDTHITKPVRKNELLRLVGEYARLGSKVIR